MRAYGLLSIACAGCGTAQETGSSAAEGAVLINEFMASNTSSYEDLPDTFPDWIELYSEVGMDLTGATLTDDLSDPTKWHFPDGTTIPPGGYLLVIADGDPLDGPLHTSFKLTGLGDDVGIYDADGLVLDSFTYEAQAKDVSMARQPDGVGAFEPDDSPTPGATND